MMTRWSTDACRRDPSIVSSNLTNPTFLLNSVPGLDFFNYGTKTYYRKLLCRNYAL